MSVADASTVDRLFREHHAALCRYLYRFTGDAELAADAAQEAFVRLIEHPPPANPRAWLFRVATNAARDAARTRSRRRLLLFSNAGRIPHADPLPQPDQALLTQERTGQLKQALGQLSEKERAALLMREEGFKQREIADAIGTTTQSVGTLLARAVKKVATALEMEEV